MLRRIVVVGLSVALVVGAAWIGQTFSQEQQPGGGERPRDAAQMQQRMEQYRQQAATRMKEALGVTDEEWTALQPKIEKVQTLARESRGGMFGFGGRGRRPGGETTTTTTTQPQTAVEQAMAALQKVLENKEATSEQIQTALKALRDARAKAQAALEAAQKDLREVLTVRQEAVLVTMRVLN